jgi:undecaprenyl diphosphate synthase
MAFSTFATTAVSQQRNLRPSRQQQQQQQQQRRRYQQQFSYGTTIHTLIRNSYDPNRIPFLLTKKSRLTVTSPHIQSFNDFVNDDDEETDDRINGSSSSSSTMTSNMNTNTSPLRHVAFICDGNSRWAKAHHLPTYMGYKQGADRLVQLLEHLATNTTSSASTTTTTTTITTLDIDYVTVYGFSTENWQRTSQEIQEIFAVMELTAQSLLQLLLLQKKQQQQQHRHPWWSSSSSKNPSIWTSSKTTSSDPQPDKKRPIQVRILGDLDDPRMPNTTRDVLKKLEQVTTTTVNNKDNNYKNNSNPLTVCLAINYGGRQDIVTACQALAQQVADGTLLPTQITQQHVQRHLSYTSTIPDPDIVIRTSGECRLSNFLLWNVAYSELYFVDTLWPDFDLFQWQKALQWYLQRQRRFGISSNSGSKGSCGCTTTTSSTSSSIG